jgi:hypothetical protein
MRVWRNCQVLSGQTSDSAAFLNATCQVCTKLWRAFFIFRCSLTVTGLAKVYCIQINHRVGIATGYGLDSQGSIPGSARFLSSPQRPDRLCGPPSLLSNGYCGALSLGVKLTTHLRLVPRSRMVELHLHPPIRVHDVVSFTFYIDEANAWKD